MEFTEALQEFLFHQGFQRIKYDSKILWGKDTNGKLSLLEIVPPVLPGAEKDVVRTTGKRNGGYRTSDYDKVPEKSRTSAIDTETGRARYRGKKRSRKLSGCMVF